VDNVADVVHRRAVGGVIRWAASSKRSTVDREVEVQALPEKHSRGDALRCLPSRVARTSAEDHVPASVDLGTVYVFLCGEPGKKLDVINWRVGFDDLEWNGRAGARPLVPVELDELEPPSPPKCLDDELARCLARVTQPKMTPHLIRAALRATKSCFSRDETKWLRQLSCLPHRLGKDARNGRELVISRACSCVCPTGAVGLHYTDVSEADCCAIGGYPRANPPRGAYVGCVPPEVTLPIYAKVPGRRAAVYTASPCSGGSRPRAPITPPPPKK
jgi:hypothetical protein